MDPNVVTIDEILDLADKAFLAAPATVELYDLSTAVVRFREQRFKWERGMRGYLKAMKEAKDGSV